MKLQLKALSIALGAATLMCGSAWGHTTAASGTGATVSTSADLKIKIIVPKVVILRVGSTAANAATVDEIEFTATAGSITSGVYTGPIPPSSSGVSVTAGSSSVPVSVWSNTGTVKLSCLATGLSGAAGTPGYSDILVGPATTVPHPGSSLAGCTGTMGAGLTVALGTALTDTWVFGLMGSVYSAGTYSATATYTATAL